MSRLVEFTTDDGGTVVVEVASTAGSIVTRGGDHAGDYSGVFARAQQTFQRALEHVRPAVQGVIDELLSLENRPDEVSVEFGIDLLFVIVSGSAGFVVVPFTFLSERPGGRCLVHCHHSPRESSDHHCTAV